MTVNDLPRGGAVCCASSPVFLTRDSWPSILLIPDIDCVSYKNKEESKHEQENHRTRRFGGAGSIGISVLSGHGQIVGRAHPEPAEFLAQLPGLPDRVDQLPQSG